MDPGYFFFLGFLTSFFGLLSLAMCDPPLQMDYNRWAGESEDGRPAGFPGEGEVTAAGQECPVLGINLLQIVHLGNTRPDKFVRSGRFFRGKPRKLRSPQFHDDMRGRGECAGADGHWLVSV